MDVEVRFPLVVPTGVRGELVEVDVRQFVSVHPVEISVRQYERAGQAFSHAEQIVNAGLFQTVATLGGIARIGEQIRGRLVPSYRDEVGVLERGSTMILVEWQRSPWEITPPFD